ncbi:MAG: LamG-like jellyroll fold domain-containing protein, partial [Isosphaerales bacterium]
MPSDSPVAYYRLNETAGLTATDSASILPQNNGTYTGSPTLGVPGLIAGTDTAVAFNGVGSVTIPNATDLNFVNAPFTIEAWFRLNSSAGFNARIFDKSTAGAGFGYGLAMNSVNGPSLFGSLNFGPTYAFASNTTYYIVATSDGAGTGTIYVNGQSIGSSSYASANPYTGVAHIGADSNGSSRFNGIIDEVAVYDHALTPDRIQAHYMAGISSVTDLAATSLAWNTTKGGVDFGYTISGSDLSQPTTTALYWAPDPTFDPSGDTLIPGSVTTTATAVGTYGPIHFDAVTLGTPPSGAKYLLAVVDPNNTIPESDETNNVAAARIQYIVANLNDAEPGSLRAVISEVNGDPITNGPDLITFAADISAGTISLQSPLPALTRDQVTVTGPITLDGSSAGGDGLDISGNQDSVQNVTVTGFSGAGVSITGSDGSIAGGQITDNENGIVVSAGATGNTIGGTDAGAGNVITGNTLDGIVLDNAQQTVIQGNWIGTDSSGSFGLGNAAVGILIEDGASDNTIGLMPTDTTTPVDQNPTANVIAFNGQTGVVITGAGTIDNVVRGNSIYGNGAAPGTADGYTYNSGIDLGDDGRTLNMYPQSTAANDANGRQNFPTSSLVKNGSATEIVGTLKSLPNTSFILDFYVNATASLQDVRQGETYLGSFPVTTDASGFAGFDVTFATATTADEGVTATATGPNGTSEMEFMYTRPILVVPGILGSLPNNADFASWLTQRGFDPSKLLADPLGNSYADLTTSLVNYGYVLGQTLFVATYDWRMPVAPLDSSGNLVPLSGMGIANDLANKQYNSGVDYLAYWLEQAGTAFNAQYPDIALDSVDVIAHSMGGLVVRAYIQSSAYGEDVPWELTTTKLPKINDFTVIATPNLGAPQSFNPSQNNWEINNGGLAPVLSNIPYEYVFSSIIEMAVKELKNGYMIGGPTTNSSITLNQVKNPDGTLNYYQFISRYVPSLFDLMSTQPFLYDGSGAGPVTVNANPLIRNNLLLDLNAPDGNGGSGLTDFESMVEQVNVIYGSGLSTDVSSTAEIGPIYSSVGIPIASVFPFDAGLPHVPSANQPWYLDQFAPNGDGTVPASSADPFEGITTVRTFNVGNVEHQALPADLTSQTDALQSLGLNTSLLPISTSLSYWGLHSLAIWEVQYRIDPVGTILTDAQGRRLGDTPETGLLEEIPDSVFLGNSSTGIAIAFGTGPVPTQFELVGLGQSYSVSILTYDSSGEFGNTATGTLASGQTQMVSLNVSSLAVTSIAPVSRNPRNTAVSTLDVTFSEPVNLSTFTDSALSLTDNNGPDLITSAVTITLVSGSTYQINGLSGLTASNGNYTLTVNAAGIQDPDD